MEEVCSPPVFNEDGEEVNWYGNPVSGDSMPYCQMPHCGCPEPRLCMAEGGWGSKYTGMLYEGKLQ